MVSQKQMLANRRNALKSTGPKTIKGKATSSRNSLKHGLLAKEVVIKKGQGAEDQQAFDLLLTDLVDQYKPVGIIEEMMLEQIAVSYWRLRRANRFEVGAICEKMDTLEDFKLDHDVLEFDIKADEKIEFYKEQIRVWNFILLWVEKLWIDGNDLSVTYNMHLFWQVAKSKLTKKGDYYPVQDSLEQTLIIPPLPWDGSESPAEPIRKELNESGFSDKKIGLVLIELCLEQLGIARTGLDMSNKYKTKNKLRQEATYKSRAIPPKEEMDKLLRYETAINRELYKAIGELEWLQRTRMGL